MADSEMKIVGLKLKVDGTVDFKKSLTEVNNAVNENRSAFKLAKSEWDKSTSSAEKLRATQEYLQNQTEAYTAKVDRLNEILKAQENAEKRDEEAISKTRQQLDNAQAALNHYKSGLEDVNQKLESGAATLQDYSQKVQNFSDATGNVGSSLNKNVTAPIAAAGSAVGEVNTRFHMTGQELEDLSQQFVEFASLNDTDVSSSIDNTQKVMEAFNLKSKDAGALLDTMNKVGQDTGISMDTLASSMVSNAASLKELGMSAADAAIFMGQCETSGVDTSTVMAGLKKALVNASGEGKSMKQALSDLQSTMSGANNSTEAYNAAIDLFGSKAGPALAQFCQEGKLNFEELGKSLNDNVGSVSDTFNATLDPADQFKLTLNQLKDEGFELGNALGPILAQCLQTVTPILKDIINSWNSLSPETQNMIIKCALLAAAVGPVISIISKVSGGVSSLIGIISKIAPVLGPIKTGFAAVNAVMAANPILIIIAAVAALIAIFVTLYNKCEWFRDGVNAIFGAVADFIKGAIDKIKGFFDFDWKLPKIKLPHFKASGEWSLSPLKVPKFSVDWYANGGILNSPTIFGQNGNSLMGGGEAGKEAVLPIELLKTYMREENESNNSVLASMIADAIQKMTLVCQNDIYIGDKKTVSALTNLILKNVSNKMLNAQGAKG